MKAVIHFLTKNTILKRKKQTKQDFIDVRTITERGGFPASYVNPLSKSEIIQDMEVLQGRDDSVFIIEENTLRYRGKNHGIGEQLGLRDGMKAQERIKIIAIKEGTVSIKTTKGLTKHITLEMLREGTAEFVSLTVRS